MEILRKNIIDLKRINQKIEIIQQIKQLNICIMWCVDNLLLVIFLLY